jgi:putative Mg2+ transporter-C (MgtC) family protein
MTTFDITVRLLLATGFGAAIGIERELRRKPAGLRTNILIAFGAALFTMVSIVLAGPGGVPDRLAGNVVVGVGFLGGGALMRSGKNIHGMTTAATIWVNAAIGMAAGAGEFAMASIATAVTLVVLAVLPAFELWAERRAGIIVPPDSHTEH